MDGPAELTRKNTCPPPADRRWQLRAQPGPEDSGRTAASTPARHRRLWDGRSKPGSRPMPNASTVKSMYGQSSSSSSSMKRWLM
ncbi:MAG: hypothetical protein ACLSAH_17375 [Bilophila wadsworthia]